MLKFENFYLQFGRIFKKHREGKNLTQDDIAKVVGLSRTSITNIECGRQKILLHQLLDLADAVQVPPTVLLPQTVVEHGNARVERAIVAAKPRVKNSRELDWVRKTVASDEKTKD